MAKTVVATVTAYVYDNDNREDQAVFEVLAEALNPEDGEQPLGTSILVVGVERVSVKDGER